MKAIAAAILCLLVACGGGDPEESQADRQPVDCTVPGRCT